MPQPVGPNHYIVVAGLLFLIGVAGVLLRRNLVIILMSIELIFNAVNLNLVAFSRHHQKLDGQVFALLVIGVAVAEAAVALGVLIAFFRLRATVLEDEINLLKW